MSYSIVLNIRHKGWQAIQEYDINAEEAKQDPYEELAGSFVIHLQSSAFL